MLGLWALSKDLRSSRGKNQLPPRLSNRDILDHLSILHTSQGSAELLEELEWGGDLMCDVQSFESNGVPAGEETGLGKCAELAAQQAGHGAQSNG